MARDPSKADGLAPRGLAFWDALQADTEFDAHDEEILLEACRTLDTIDQLSEAIASDGVMVVGSQGQPVLNGAIAERRQQQQSLGRLIAMLNLDAEYTGAILQREATKNAKKAANARWAPLKAVERA